MGYNVPHEKKIRILRFIFLGVRIGVFPSTSYKYTLLIKWMRVIIESFRVHQPQISMISVFTVL